jgi:uncharacterized protein (PEP-CTERM system associated)
LFTRRFRASSIEGTAVSLIAAMAFVPLAARAQIPADTQPDVPTRILDRSRAETPSQTETRTRVLQPAIGLEELWTNNVNLQPSDARRSDFVTTIRPSVLINATGAHSRLVGSVAVPIVLYAHTGNENNQVYPQVDLVGNAELVERLFFIDGAINVSQQFFTPFGARPENLESATDNRYTSQMYRVSPYIKGEASGGIKYELRDDNIWNIPNDAPTSFNGASINTAESYTNQVIGRIGRDPLPLGWQVDYDRSEVRFTDQDPQLMELGRLRLLVQTDPRLQLGVSGGYERNEFPFSEYSGVIYGAGFKWRPSPVASSEGFWEHRFFGSSYGFSLDYRTPLSVWRVDVSRGITTYPQQLAALPVGGDVQRLLNSVFSSRIVDPTERQALIDQIIRDRGLPETLTDSVTLYTQQVTLQEIANATFGLLGARNSIFFTATYLRQEPIAGSGNPLPPDLAGLNNNTQYGANIVWTHQLAPLVSLGGNVAWARTVPNAPIVLASGTENIGTTNLTTVRVYLSRLLSPRTIIYGGARYQVQTSNSAQNEYDEAAVFVGVNYGFR